jgi:hypothetical protein
MRCIKRVLLATVRDKGICPCPRCLVPMTLIHRMGTRADVQMRTDTLRRDNLHRQKLIKRARFLIYNDNKAVNNDEVEELLQPKSFVPTEVSFRYFISVMSMVNIPIYYTECLLTAASAT